MTQLVLRGLAASGGVAVGRALVIRDPEPELNGGGGDVERERALDALALLSAELGRLADLARARGRDEEADILDANRLIAEDPVLRDEVLTLAHECRAETAVRRATARHADLLADLDDSLLAARAADVRQLGVRAARLLAGSSEPTLPGHPVILLARDLGPADIAGLEHGGEALRGIALAEGSATSHVAIMARSLGVPMAVGVGVRVLETSEGEHIVLDGENGVVVVGAAAAVRRQALAAASRHEHRRSQLAALRGLPAVTRDGRELKLLCNAATPAEVAAGLSAGADGVGLLRTELAFLDGETWPTEDEHLERLEPMLGLLDGRTATVRTLDFGADKTPPFLAGIAERGIALMLAHREALEAQLRAILRAGKATKLRVLLPLVETPEQVLAVRRLLSDANVGTGVTASSPELGAMIETPAAVTRVNEIAAVADFISIGTNDLVQYALGLDRALPLATAQAAADPAVLELIDSVVRAAHARGVSVEVCGEAAGEAPVAALLVGLGVDELSVAPARVDEIRALVRGQSWETARAAAQAALAARSAADALALASELSAELGDERGKARDSFNGVVS